MGDVRRKFMNPLLVVFSGPEQSDLSAWLKTYEGVLVDYSDEALSNAANRIISTRMFRNFPLPAECLDACKSAKLQITMLSNVPAQKLRPRDEVEQ